MTMASALTQEQIEEIRSLLLEKKQTIERDIRRNFSRFLEESSEESTVVDMEDGDESRVDVGKEMSYQVMSRWSRELKKINEGLQRIDSGEYGVCDECESRIRFERLKAMPFAQLCLNCQQESEEREKERQKPSRGPFRL
jgi:DnaK suppressor protein